MTLNHMVDEGARIDSVFRALGDPSRLSMVERLSHGPATVSELAEPLDMSLAGASKHVGVLETAGLLVRKKRGRERVCELQPKALFAARDWVQRYTVFWNERLDALGKALREDGDE